MQSAKKTKKILSALSMAAVATLAAKSAHGATLSLYYGQDPSLANSNNAVVVSPTYTPGTSSQNATGGFEYFGAAGLPQAIAPSGPTTINLPVGSYLSLAIDAVLTGNSNPDGGKKTSSKNITQPSFLGLSELGMSIGSSDAGGAKLTPISNDAPGSSSASGTYNSTAQVNTLANGSAANSGTAIGPAQGSNGGAYNVIPNWGAITAPGDIKPNINGYTPGPGNGNVGLNGFITGGNTSVGSSTAGGVSTLEAFASSTSTNGYTNATEFFDSLVYQGLAAGTVTLTPTVAKSSTAYWTLKTAGAPGGAASIYNPTTLSTDTINNLPVLVINVIPSITTGGHPIVSLAATASANAAYAPTVGSLTITGSAATGYTVAQVTGLSATTGNVNTSAWNATTDPEIYGVDVKVGGVQATPAQLAALLAAINGTDLGGEGPSLGVLASTTDPTGGALAALDTATTTYNLFLKYAAGGPSAPLDNLGLDLSNSNDSNLTGYTFTAVSVVPEPMSLGLLALGGVSLMSRRSRRKA